MDNEISIVSEPGSRPESVANISGSPVIEADQSEPVIDIAIEDVTYKGMVQETLDNYIEKVLDFSKLPRTQENLDKCIMNLNKKFDSWLSEGNFILEDISDQDYATHFLEEACRRRGLPNNTQSWKKIMKEIN